MSDQFPRSPIDQEPPRRGVSGVLIFVLILVIGAVALYFLVQRFPGALSGQDNQISLVYLVVLGVVVLLSALSIRRLDGTALARYLRYGALWAGIFVVLAGGYSYRTEMRSLGQRIMGDMLPGYGGATGPNELTYTRAEDGHFYVDTESSQVPVRFLVDTGATLVVLSPGDAQRLGFDLTKVRFDQYFQTANGTVRGASAVLNELWFGERVLRNVPVSINEAPMSDSLLGMSFLQQLDSFEVRGDHLILRWSAN
ncbi:TIGR02281 family clan AA aspartic protease [Pelagibius sp. Alg239-R121]|uniref:retropepsin-like aspartic protease family protein n=1 Tax=Pelagibius sp. Alg239-R121 TaxID=2993448 RepID=UPI0024A69BD6|nr:TIGR02281 family clan AA aspartic protease [Pelagibius sp. Alg239-R121]